MARRQFQCRSKMQKNARVIVGCFGMAELTGVENSKPFEGRRVGGVGFAQECCMKLLLGA